MSYFLFGSFNASQDKKIVQDIKEYVKKKDIYIWFNEEITFYKEIQRMLLEQKAGGNIQFAVTSINQPHNSNDVLFPFDKVIQEVLFINGTRDCYKKCCRSNIDIVFDCLHKLMDSFDVRDGKIFVVEGYDDIFQRKKCNLDEMRSDLLMQIENEISIASCIYYVNR